MDIFGHLINDQEIIGISPLFSQAHTDQSMQVLYKCFRYLFYVHTKQQSVSIQSDYFYPEQGNEVLNKEDKDKRNQWRSDYNKARQMVADHIGELIHEKN